jgi:DNA-binding transcriptional regulator of glucitol operon
MAILEQHFDRLARKSSLNWAIVSVILWPAFMALGVLQLHKYSSGRDSFYLYAGLFNIGLSILGTFNGIGILHAVVRRLVAEARESQPE